MSEDVDESSEGLAEEGDPTICAGFSNETQDYEEHCDTEFGPQIWQQAWSHADPAPPVKPYRHHSWGRVGVMVAGIALVSAVILGAAVNSGDSGQSVVYGPVTSTPPPPDPDRALELAPDPPPLPAVSDAGHISQDGVYLHRLRTANLIGDLTPDQADKNVAFAHNYVCRNLAAGFSIDVIARYDHLYHPNEPWTEAQDAQWARIAADVYCPGLV